MAKHEKTDKFLNKKPVKAYVAGEEGKKPVYGLTPSDVSAKAATVVSTKKDLNR